MRFVWDTAIKDWRRHRRDPIGILMWIGIPILIGGLITMASGGKGGVTPKAHVLIADEDDTIISGLLVGALGQDAMGGLIEPETVAREDGEARMREGDATALLIIPQGFGQAVLEETPTTLELLTNPSQRILPGIVEESLSILVDATFYVHRVIGEDLAAMSQAEPGNAQIAAISIKINALANRVADYVSPMLIQIETVVEEEEEAEENVSIALLFIPGILFMSLLFMAQGLSSDLWQERDQKTLRRVVVTPRSTISFLLGKLVSGCGLMSGVTFIALTIGFAYFELDARIMPAALLWSILSGLFLTTMMIVIQVYAPTQQAGSVITMTLIFPLMMVGGSFFPFEAMPAWMAAIGKLTPNGWALEQLKAIILQRLEPGAFVVALTGLVVVGIVLFLISARRLTAGFAQG